MYAYVYNEYVPNTRVKEQMQAEAAIKKYDHTIGSKMLECLDIEDLFSVEQDKLDQLMLIHSEVERDYNKIVVSRETLQEQNKKKVIHLYMMNRAARKIQVYWRRYRKAVIMKRRKSKRKSKKWA